MKRNRLTRLLSVLLGAVFAMSWAGATLGVLPPGSGPMTGSENETGEGAQDRERDCEELSELFGLTEEEWPITGPGFGALNDEGAGDQERDRDPSTH